jgi:alpha-galactosidase
MNRDPSNHITRRAFLLAAAGTGVCSAGTGTAAFVKAPGFVVLSDETRAGASVSLRRHWEGMLCRSDVINTGKAPVRVKEVVLFSFRHGLPGETRLYGEGFTMLSQTGGTLSRPEAIGAYTDAKHYRIPQPAGTAAYYGMLLLSPPRANRILLGFASCRRFCGKFIVREGVIDVVVDAENLELAPGERWELEEFLHTTGEDREQLLAELASSLTRNHATRLPSKPPAGWCSWYMMSGPDEIVGSRITSAQVRDNLDDMTKRWPELRYVQIDEGYSSHLGDWLDTGKAFGGEVQGLLRQIRERGLQPAIWVAPFIAEENSRLFQEHPDWFVQGTDGRPLRSDRVTFGGWHNGPWYALDGTHPEACKHLEHVFGVMRREWGCTYFKLDANFWGAMHGGRHFNPKATRVEAYRQGMQALRRGAGDDAFILGCNHPLWPSLGLISGSRNSNDTDRKWKRIADTARENLSRNWQNGKLWWADPDCLLLTGNLSEAEYRFHATAVYATGGAILSGDNLPSIPPARVPMLRKILPPTGVAARFEDETLKVGRILLPDRVLVCLFNWSDQPQSLSFRIETPGTIRDFWTDQDFGTRVGVFPSQMAARSAALLVVS